MVQTFLTVFVILTHITWAPVLFGWGSLAQFLHSEWDQTLFRASWELCYRQLYLSLISPLPQSLFPPSPPSHHRTLLHHACNYGATGEMSVAKFSLAVSVGNRGFRAIQFEFSGLVTPGSWTWSLMVLVWWSYCWVPTSLIGQDMSPLFGLWIPFLPICDHLSCACSSWYDL